MRALLVYSALLLAALGATDFCKNGGVLKEGTTDDCVCQSYWTGKEATSTEAAINDCSVIECVNGGYPVTINNGPNEKQVCHCPRGYYGIHCDAVKQARPVEGEFNTMKKSFNLYIHNELTDWYGFEAYYRIKEQIPKIVVDYKASFKSYNLFESKRPLSGKFEDAELALVSSQTDQALFFGDVKAKMATERTRTYTCKPTSISYKLILEMLKEQKIEDSVMLMFTQYPPDEQAENTEYLEKLKEYLRAFRVKLNVLIGSDEILLDCHKKDNPFGKLTDLVHFTDGEVASFIVETSDEDEELLPSFIRASASPQSHSRAASESCAIGLNFEFQTDPYPNKYFIAVRTDKRIPATIKGTCTSGGELNAVAVSDYEEFALSSIISGAQQRCNLTVTAKGGCLATVYSIGGETDVDVFDIFHSFATSADMDSDSIHTFTDEEYFLTMHIEVSADGKAAPKYPIVAFGGTVIVKNEDQQEKLNKALIKRQLASTFDYQSEAFPCVEGGASWIQLNLEGFNKDGVSVAVLDRMIKLNCEERTKSDDSTPKNFRLMDEAATPKQKPTIALMYSNSLPIPEFSRFILASVDEKVVKDRFSQYGFIRFDAKQIMDFVLETDFGEFKKKIYDTAPDDSLGKLDNLNQHLEKLTSNKEKYITSDTLVSIAIQHSEIDPKVVDEDDESKSYAKNLAELANLGARLLFWGDVGTVKIEEDSDSLEVYIRMAAISAGHVVLMDMYDFDEEDDAGGNPFYVSLALRDLYSSGPSQRLLAYSNLQWDQSGATTTSQSSPIGTLQVPEGTSQVFVSITLNVENPLDISPAFMLTIVLEGANDRQVLDINSFTQYGPAGVAKSNLYTANITVAGGESYEGTFTVLAMTPFTGAHIRFWVERGDEDIPDLTYVNFDQKIIQPDDYLGAALRVSDPDPEGKAMSLRFLNENGVEANRLDNNQTVDIVKGVAHFVPYFCNSAQSKKLSKETYTVELTYDSGFKYFRPLFCSKGATPKTDCKKADDGNSYCVESNPPFHRGPSQTLVDCSGVGQVVYTETKDPETGYYKCNCDPTFAGKSCEQSSCAAGINHLPEETDSKFRTLSFVLMSPAGQEACSSIAAFYADDAKLLFDETKSYENIWQYTFSVYFTDGTAKTLYRGPSFQDFNNVFGTFKDDDFDTINFCGDEKNKAAMDMNEVFNLAVESVGRDSRGIVFLYAAQTFYDQNEENELYNAFASNELYQSIQAYQQHIYMVTPTVIPDFISLTTASGGFAVRTYNEYTSKFEASMPKLREIFDTIHKSEIGWAGISTEAKPDTPKPNTWTLVQDAELFITSRTINGGAVPEVKVNGVLPADIFTFSTDGDNDGVDDFTITRHAAISATEDGPATISVEFSKEESAYDTIQIVILTTKDDPIRNALIGQGQANTDKHAAGATNTSIKAAHISFNRQSTQFFFKPTDDNWRQASRIDCSFAQEFVAFTQPFQSVGASVVDFTVSPMDTDPTPAVPVTTKSFSLAVPLAVSETIDCVNGNFQEEGSYCKCSGGWSGPTCSQPSCGDGGRLNAHGDHCDCTAAEFGGPFCKKKSSVQESDEE